MKYFAPLVPLAILAGVAVVLGGMYLLKTDPTCKEAIRLRDTETTHARWERWVVTTDEEWRGECFE